MKSILSKFVLLISICVLTAAIFIGVLSITRFSISMTEASEKTLNLTCSENAKSLNIIIDRMEKSVEILADYTVTNLTSDTMLKIPDALDGYVRKIETLGRSITEGRDGAVGLYVRFAPEVANENAGFYLVKNCDTNAFEKIDTTSIGESGNPDFEWYYTPKSTGEATWILPYTDSATGREVISFVCPMYKQYGNSEPIFLGVAGIDVSFDYFTGIIDNIGIYESGFAFLTDSNLQIIYSKSEFTDENDKAATIDITSVEESEAVYEYRNNGSLMIVTFRSLDNGMCIAATVSHDEVHHDILLLIIEITLITLCFIVIFLYISFTVAKNIINPLQELSQVAIQVSEGNLDVDFDYQGKDEIATLTQSLKTTVKELKKRISFTDSLAYQDSLTGLNNVTAYTRDREKHKVFYQDGGLSYALFIIDINGLKTINDTFGHKAGNDLIIQSGKIIGSVFGYENVYRVGGDEFVVFVHGANEESCRALKASLDEALLNCNGKIQPSLAIGYAISCNTSDDYEHIFELADEAMYKEKIKIKSSGITSRIIK